MAPSYLEDIIRKLVVEKAKSLSDAEIERILSPCVLGHLLIPLAKKYRKERLLVFGEVKARIKKYMDRE